MADMVQVNGYIVAVRACAEMFVGMKPEPGKVKCWVLKLAASSSSHIAIGDPFSSSSSP
jgi:hypothetical protein